jgi:flagellar hook-associated protein 1 FlgK
MADLLTTGLSGLLAFQRALDTTSHNIANVNTAGFSRQRVEVGTLPASALGNGFVGNGAQVQTVRRTYDDFIALQARTSSSSLESFSSFAAGAERLNNLLGDTNSGLTATLQKFVNAFQGVANSPSSIPARQVLLGEAEGLQARLQTFDSRLSEFDGEVNARIRGDVAEINTLANGIAKLNLEITSGLARSGGQPPNDLLDQRDRLLDELSQKVSVNAVRQDGGIVNVFIGSGQPLVLSTAATELSVTQDPFDATRLQLGVRTQGGVVDVTRNISGGSLGGVLEFRNTVLDPAHNALGRFSVALVETVNAQHREGLDLTGTLGGDFFALGAVQTFESSANTGDAALAITRADVGALTERDYVLQVTATGFALSDARTGIAVPFTGLGTTASPLSAEGLEIAVASGTAAVGDRFLIQPTRAAISGLDVLVTDPSRVAAAAPIRTAVAATNVGSGKISAGEVLDATNANLRNTVTLQFTSATTYSINGAGSFPYTSGGNIDINGARVQLSGTPALNDRFTISDNSSGLGDNRNALLLTNALQQPVLNGGTTSLTASIGQFIGGIGVTTRQAQVSRDAQQVVHEETIQARSSVSGVNLDEEAANLLKFQQAYQAAAQLIRIADTLFQSLLGATSR